MKDVLGRHLIIELIGCSFEKLNCVDFVSSTLLNIAKTLKVTVLNSYFHEFAPQGVSGAVVIAESHISIHTWPELGYAALDVFTCGARTPLECLNILQKSFCAQQVKKLLIYRGTQNTRIVDS